MIHITKLKGITIVRKFTMQDLGKELQNILKSINSTKNKESLIKNKKKLIFPAIIQKLKGRSINISRTIKTRLHIYLTMAI